MGIDSIRLYEPPNQTVETLRAVISGADSREKIAEKLEVSPRTAWNKIHDPLSLGLIEREDEGYVATKDARRLVQLDDEEVLKTRFKELPGVDQILERIEDGGITTEEVGRIISFETDSGAADMETFESYGRVYARWIERLELGEIEDVNRRLPHPLEKERGANSPTVRPKVLIEALRHVDDSTAREDLAERIGHSERTAGKILSTAYALDLMHRERGGGFSITNSGRTIISTSEGKKREILCNKLLEIPLVQAYCNRVPSGEFSNQEIMELVNEDYSMGWSDGTVKTKAKRLYQWLIFTKLAEEERRGVLIATDKMPRGNLPEP